MIGRGLFRFLAYAVGFGMGFVVVLQVVVALVASPYRIPVAMIAFVAYVYAFGRWILRLKIWPLMWLAFERLKQTLHRYFHG